MYTFVMYATCPLHYFLKARYDLLVRFLLRGFTCTRGHTRVGKIADVHHEKGKRSASVLTRSLHTSPRDNANKKGVSRVTLDAIFFSAYAVENISQIF